MSRCWVCDCCKLVMDDYPPLELSEDTGEVDDDGDVIANDRHFCGVGCLSTWAMTQAFDKETL